LHIYIGQVLNDKTTLADKTFDNSGETLMSAVTSTRAQQRDDQVRKWIPESADLVIAALNGLRRRLKLM
jgi:hypothetical protein